VTDRAGYIPGAQLSHRFYEDVLAAPLSNVPHAAARVGGGSEVLGFDTPRSTDHGWGPTCQIFVAEEDVDSARTAVERALPDTFLGWPVRYGWDEVAVTHHVEIGTLSAWLNDQLGIDPRDGLRADDWLLMPQQRLLQVTSGAVFHDETGQLTRVRELLSWYPHDVWVWMLACAWRRIEQEEPFVGRTAEVGDELGSRILVARVGRDLLRLCFLIERRYAPYSKWLGSAFAKLDAAAEVEPALERAMAAGDYTVREAALVVALEAVARRFNALGITPDVEEPTARPFHTRPFLVLMAERFVAACLEAVHDEWLRSLPLVGSIDQFIDSTDVLEQPNAARRVREIYGLSQPGSVAL
jgi:hypothetical protein